MKTVLLVITRANMGGAQQFVLSLASGLQQAGWNVIVGCGEKGYLTDELEKKAISIHLFTYLRRTHNPFKNIWFIRELQKFVKQNHIDLVHLNSSNTLLGAIGLIHTKTIATIHGLSFADPYHRASQGIKSFYKILFKLLLHFIDQPVFVSKHNQKYALESHLTKKGRVIYNNIDPTNLFLLPREEARGIVSKRINRDISQKFVIGTIGRYAYPKNFEFLIKQFPEIKKIIPEAQLLIIGEGPEREKYQKMINEAYFEHEIFLTGEIAHGSQYLKGFDLFILPSLYEGLPYVILEALIARIPILATRVGGIPELLDEKYLFDPNRSDEFLTKLTQLQTQQWPLPTAPQLMTENMVENYIKLYNNLLAS
jgi:glycosyltransferase involved in cell wall biosynthesis